MHTVRDTPERVLTDHVMSPDQLKRFFKEPGDTRSFEHLPPLDFNAIYGAEGDLVHVETNVTRIHLVDVHKSTLSVVLRGPDKTRAERLVGERADREHIGILAEIVERALDNPTLRNFGPDEETPQQFNYMRCPNTGLRVDVNTIGSMTDNLSGGFNEAVTAFGLNSRPLGNCLWVSFSPPRHWSPRSIQDLLDQNSYVRHIVYNPSMSLLEITVETRYFYVSTTRQGERDPFFDEQAQWNQKAAYCDYKKHYLSKKKAFLAQIKANLEPQYTPRSEYVVPRTESEQKAIETLREMITEGEYRRYMKNGFLLVRGDSGRVYQVFRDRWHTVVWDRGKRVEEVCTRLKDSSIPPTDNVIAFKIAIEADEESFKKRGNVYRIRTAA